MGKDWPVRIIVVGAGEVGSYVAERLSSQGHHVALIESDPVRFREIQEQLDVMTILGSGTDPLTLGAAGVEDADLLVAVTPYDETNILSALLARGSGVSKTVVRVESRRLRHADVEALFDGVDDHLVIDPDEEVAHAVLRLMEYPGAMEVNQMAGGEVEVLTARLPGHAPLISEVRPGVIDVYQGDVIDERIFVAGGFAEVNTLGCTVLSGEAYPLDELDKGDVEERRRDAEDQLANAADDLERAAAEAEIALCDAMLTALE